MLVGGILAALVLRLALVAGGLAVGMARLAYLERAIGILLCLIGLALCIEPFHSVPEWALLTAVVTTIAAGVIASLASPAGRGPGVSRP